MEPETVVGGPPVHVVVQPGSPLSATWVHDVPSHVQVSFNGPRPPKSTSFPMAASYAMAAPLRAWGLPEQVLKQPASPLSATWVHVVPFQFQVSFKNPMPPPS